MILAIIFCFIVFSVMIFSLLMQNTKLKDQLNHQKRVNKHLDEQLSELVYRGFEDGN